VRLREQPAGIESDDLHVDRMLPQRVEDHLVLEPEARGKNDGSEHLAAHPQQSLIERQRRSTKTKVGAGRRETLRNCYQHRKC
jgi:hypothetical protein